MRRFVGTVVFLIGALACGSRTQLNPAQNTKIAEACLVDSDCAATDLCGHFACVYAHCKRVEDKKCPPPSDSCRKSECVPETGACAESPLTPDFDEDGHRAALPGTTPGSPGSCGDDCDDAHAEVLPGGNDVCDGTDNDCDGIIDNGQFYLRNVNAIPASQLVPTTNFVSSGRRDIAFQGEGFAVSFWGREGEQHAFMRGLDVDGFEVFPETPLTNANASSFGASLAYSGQVLAAAWPDARLDDNYEVYFATFDVDGKKRGPDLRITSGPDFSIHPDLLYDQGRFLLAYDDRRPAPGGPGPRIFAQVIDVDGNPTGAEVQVTEDSEQSEVPSIAATDNRIGMVYVAATETALEIRFRHYNKDFSYPSDFVTLESVGGRSPRIVSLQDNFLVTWESEVPAGPGPSIYGMLLSETGEVLVPARELTWGAQFARTHSTLSLGDRAVLVWADDYDGNYEIYAKVISESLDEIEPRVRLTFDDADSYSPALALSDDGHIGVVYDDKKSGPQMTYFVSLGCNP